MSLAQTLSQRRGRYTLPTPSRQPQDGPVTCPSPENIVRLCEPIAQMLHSITCFDTMGNSTQVVVVDTNAALKVCFMAAHETRASCCVLWDATRRVFDGIITITDYIKVLLYCQEHPEEADAIQNLTLRAWRERNEETRTGPPLMVSASADDTLATCLDKMFRHRIHRLPILAEHEELNSFSLVSILSFPQLNHYMCRALFSEGDGSDGALLLPPSVQSILLGGSPGQQGQKGTDLLAGPPLVEDFVSIFDVPLSCIPHLGKHRRSQHTVRMNSKLEDALRMLVECHVQAVAVVDDANVAIDVISRSDVMRMEVNGFYDLGQSVSDALSFRVGGSVFAVHESMTIRDVILHFTAGGVKELFIVDPETDALIGQLGLTEVLFFLYTGRTDADPIAT